MWFPLIFVILLRNGMSSFGLKVIARRGLPLSVKFPYLAVSYAAVRVCIGAPMLFEGIRAS